MKPEKKLDVNADALYAETGTPLSGYEERGPYRCGVCIHLSGEGEPFCIHPVVLADPEMKDRIRLVDGKPAAKIDLEKGCCKFVRTSADEADTSEEDESKEDDQ